MTEFAIHTPDTAPEASREVLAGVEAQIGFVPNLFGAFATSPVALEAYAQLSELFGKTTFTPVEQQVIALSVSFDNTCDYCMAAHTGLARMAGIGEDALAALRTGEPIADSRLNALSSFTRSVVQHRGFLPEEDVTAFLAAGFTREQILEVIVGVTMKTMSNYTNHIVETPLDEQFKAFEWSKPAVIGRAG